MNRLSLAWLRMAPFGAPVVPDVYMKVQVSFDPIATCGSLAEERAISCS